MSTGLTPIAIAADASFRTAFQQGTYRLCVSGFPPGLILKSMTSGDVDLLAEPLRIEPQKGPAVPEVVVTFAEVSR